MDLSRIAEYNPWWDTGEVRKELCPSYERSMLEPLMSNLGQRPVTLLRGPRRTGKSTLLYQAIRRLLAREVPREDILYFSFDDEAGTVQDLLDEYRTSVLGRPFEPKDRVYVFLDEVQKCGNWAEQVKRNYDLYPNIKFVLSGSVSFEIGAQATDSLVGRANDIILLPMSFGEYLGLRRIDMPPLGSPLRQYLLAERRLKPYFGHFLMTGGFPELATEKDRNVMSEYIKSSIISKAIYQDILRSGWHGDHETIMALLRAIAENPGMILSYERLGSDLGRDRRTISSYLSALEYAMVIRTLGNLRGSSMSSSRKNRKAYPISPGLTFAFKGYALDDTDMGRVMETAVLNQIEARHFWRRRGNEVDFVLGNKGDTAVEVKYRRVIGRLHFEQYARFNRLKTAVVVTKDGAGSGRTGAVIYTKVPSWALCAGAGITGLQPRRK